MASTISASTPGAVSGPVSLPAPIKEAGGAPTYAGKNPYGKIDLAMAESYPREEPRGPLYRETTKERLTSIQSRPRLYDKSELDIPANKDRLVRFSLTRDYDSNIAA